jgi:enoyl-CoA hydratase
MANPSAHDVVRTERRHHVLVITLDRPAKRNAVDGAMAAGLEAAVTLLEQENDLWIGVLAAVGPVFCAGADLVEVQSPEPQFTTIRGGFAGVTELARTKPLVAAVDGAALAGGLEICLACDMIIASPAASFGLPEVKRSLVAGAGGLVRLPAALPRNVAMEMALTGEPISGERAHELGLVNHLTEPDAVLDRAIELAELICGNAPLAVRRSRAVIMESHDPDRAWAASKEALRFLVSTEDFREGPQAFLERRAPVWTGC